MSAPYTFADLKAELRLELFPQDEADVLVVAHNKYFLEAMVELQDRIPCQKLNNTQTVPACNTLFRGGLTVIDKPPGEIRRLYTLDRINQTTGQEDATQPIDWNSQVFYEQVEYDHLNRYISAQLAAASPFANFWGWFTGIFGGMTTSPPVMAFPSFWFSKWTYPAPTDAGLETAPGLPLGFHYQQPSTDAPHGRAQFGMFAIKNSQIFIAPWIQSTEEIIIEWDGTKRNWQDTDLVNAEDPLFKKAIREYVRMENEDHWGHDPEELAKAQGSFNRTIADMMYNCRKRHREQIDDDQTRYMAEGTINTQPTYTNISQTATAQCPVGQVGSSVTVTIPDNAVVSLVSVEDANAKAKSLALQQAGTQLVCTTAPVVFQNALLTQTFNCSNGGSGNPVNITIAQGKFTSTLSQQDADSQALAAATAQAASLLVCTWTNDQKTATGLCSDGVTSHTETVPAGTVSSTVSKDDANSQAQTQANNQLVAWQALHCPTPPTVYNSTSQTVSFTYQCNLSGGGGGRFPITSTITVPAGRFQSTQSQAAANNLALLYGQQLAQQTALNQCHAQGGN